MVVDEANIKKEFGVKVRTLREQLGLNKNELAEKAGLDRTFIWGIENGTRNPSLQSMYKISKALKVKLTDLITGF